MDADLKGWVINMAIDPGHLNAHPSGPAGFCPDSLSINTSSVKRR